MSDEKERGVIFTPKVEEEGRIDEFPNIQEVDAENKIIEVTPDPKSVVIPPEELQKINEEIKAEIDAELDAEEKAKDELAEELDDADDLNKKTYIKITPTFYIKPAGSEKNAEGEDVKLYKILNPETLTVEKRQLTDVEKHDVLVRDLKESHIKFRPVKHPTKTVGMVTVTSSIGRKHQVRDKEVQTNLTTHQFGADYRKKRKNKNRMARASRKANR